MPVGSGQVYTVAQSNLGSLLGSMLNHPHWIGIVVTTGQPGGSGQVYVTTQSNLGLSMSYFLSSHILSLFLLYVNICGPLFKFIILGYNNLYHLNFIGHWHVPNMPTYIFHVLHPTLLPPFVRNVITCVGLVTIQPNFINVRKRGNQEHVIHKGVWCMNLQFGDSTNI